MVPHPAARIHDHARGAVVVRPLAVRAFGCGASAHDKVALSKEETETPS
jgi:hypothetical protein